jgi:flagellin
MSSILTNNAAMTALQNLTATQKALSNTQGQISTGLRIQEASDNAAYWSIATTMKSDTSALSAVTDALNLGASVVSTATAAVDATLTIMNKLKADLVSAQTPGTNAAQVQTDIVAQQKSLLNIIASASFNGVNLLDGTQTANSNTAKIAAAFTRTSSGTNIGYISIDTSSAGTQLTGSGGVLASAIASVTATLGSSSNSTTGAVGNSGVYAASSVLGFTVVGANATDLTAISAGIDAAITAITSKGAALGTASTGISNQTTYISSLSSAITSGVGSLVDADMNEASTRLNALQTQQQLGVQSLSIANQNSQMILKLFQ